MRSVRWLFTVVLLLLAAAAPAQAEKPVELIIEEKLVAPDAQPVWEDGVLMVPVRATFEGIGYAVSYDPGERRIDLASPVLAVSHATLWAGRATALVDGVEVSLKGPVVVREGRAYVSVELFEHLQCKVRWKESSGLLWVDRAWSAEALRAFDRLREAIELAAYRFWGLGILGGRGW